MILFFCFAAERAANQSIRFKFLELIPLILMNNPAASDGVSNGKFYTPQGRGIKPSSASGGLNTHQKMP
jgi:hypothetical protein